MKRFHVHTAFLLFCISNLTCAKTSITAMQGDSLRRELVSLSYGQDGAPLNVTIIYPENYRQAKDFERPVLITLPPGGGKDEQVQFNLEKWWEDEGRKRGFLVVSPELLGVQIEGRGKMVFDAVFKWLDDNVSYNRGNVVISGASNGGIGAFSGIIENPDRFAAMIALPGFHLKAFNSGNFDHFSVLREKNIWLIVGERDSFWRRNMEVQKEHLEAHGARVRLTILAGQDHIVQMPQSELFDWIENILE